MRIWIDGYEANVPQRLGSSQVAFELLRSLWKLDPKNDYTILLPAPPLGDLPKERIGWKYKILKPKALWTKIALPLAIYKSIKKPDLFFSPTHYIPRFCPKKVKRVATFFDLSFIHFPEMFTKKDLWQLREGTKFTAENADHIITISNFSKEDIIRQYLLEGSKVTVAYPGYNKDNFKYQIVNSKNEGIKNKYRIRDSYLIYIGTIQPRKNLKRLIEAFARVVKMGGEPYSRMDLVIVGKSGGEGRKGWMYEDILKYPKELEIEDKVKFLGFVPNEDLAVLLSGAVVYIQPSLWEGFGIPVVEAMAVGTPVIVSNVSSLPEVVGNAGILIDPYSVDQIEQAIRTIVSDKKLRQKFLKEGIQRAQEFSWDQMAKVVLKVFEKIAS